jgi:dephospho-CoA kinase
VSLVWITGMSGVGKSSVHRELRRRGRASFDADEDGICAWHDPETGNVVDDQRADGQWAAGHVWRIRRHRVAELARAHEAGTVFLCGAVANEVDVWDLFDHVICLVADDDTLRHRLRARTTNDFGKDPGELAAILGWNATIRSRYEQFGATIIAATLPLPQVTDAVLAAQPVKG